MLRAGGRRGGRGREKKMTVYCCASNGSDGSVFSAVADTRQIVSIGYIVRRAVTRAPIVLNFGSIQL